MKRYTEHAKHEYAGFKVVDATLDEQDLIWVGFGGAEGRWLTAAEVTRLSGLLAEAATSHMTRLGAAPRTA